MTVPNPYSVTQAGNLFVGYRSEREEIVSGLRGGTSFAVIGGRRCGKTSLLMQLHDDLLEPERSRNRLIPRLVDMQGVVPRTPHDFFAALERAITRDLPVKPWTPPASKPAYQSFLERMKKIEGPLNKAFGPSWTVVLLIDELDVAAKSLQSEECFQNLRSLLSFEACRRSFRVVCAGVNSLVTLIQNGSPLNILDKTYTRALSAAEAEELGTPAYDYGHPPAAIRKVLRLAGGHAYIVQALLSYLWSMPKKEAPRLVDLARKQFITRRIEVLERWKEDVGSAGRAVYEGLLSSHSRARVPADSLGLNALSFHGLIDTSGPSPRVSCELFRDWYLGSGKPPRTPARQTVFVASGRDRQAHESTCEFLCSLELEPLDWKGVIPKTGKGTPSALEVLDKAFQLAYAVVVVLTPDDEARLKAAYRKPDDPRHEEELNGQPRENVILEAGMALKMFPTRTILLQVGGIRPMSDLAGLQILKMSNRRAAREELRARLKSIGCRIDEQSTTWQTAGDFTL